VVDRRSFAPPVDRQFKMFSRS